MSRYSVILIIFVLISAPLLLIPARTQAIISTAATGGGTNLLQLCAVHPLACGVAASVAAFLAVFGKKLSCLFGSEQDMFAAGLSPQTVVKDSAYNALPGVAGLRKSGPFGGQIIKKFECKCDGGNLASFLGKKEVMLIGSPTPMMIGVTATTKNYDYRSFQEGNWLLGEATSQRVCRIPVAYGIKYVGTSR